MKPTKNARICLIGGCGSSGTTLITSRLSLHPQVLSGRELNFFNHRSVYSIDSVRSNLQSLSSGKAPTFGYFDVERFLTYTEDFSFDRQSFEDSLKYAREVSDMFQSTFSTGLTRKLASQVIEKTPTNCYAFDLAVDIRCVNGVILVIRDPRDVCASLKERGFNVFAGATRWIFDTLVGLRAKDHAKFRLVRFEDFCLNHTLILNEIFEHLGLNTISSSMMEELVVGADMRIWSSDPERARWRFTPEEHVAEAALGSWMGRLSPEEVQIISNIRLTRRTQLEFQLPDVSVKDLAMKLGYSEWTKEPISTNVGLAKTLMDQDIQRRVNRAKLLGRPFIPVGISEVQ